MDRELFKKIRRIQIQTTHLAEDILAGAYHSAFKGKGMEFEEVREYQPGDEIRHIDWNVTARMSHLYVKNFKEEREITVFLLVDISASSRFGSQNLLKSELIAEIGAVLAFSANKNQDRVGLILFSDQVESYLSPKKGLRHVLRVVRDLLVFSPQHSKTDLGAALAFLGKVQRKAAICFLISDFLATGYEHQAKLIAQGHDLISICVQDPFEAHIPPLGLLNMQDLETESVALIDSNQPQNPLRESAQAHLRDVQFFMKTIGADFLSIRTDQPFMPVLRKFFKVRGMKR
ncbi:DUF58 domain-containing protein [Parachlamydia sp. AcF125]|uniref:DUF58 domain-containing protein n=1 Tax=Parachlamydia sp. AcF125 TaxID=2795736 RepID=UPI001BC99E2F|nr:DUF58 domain-containing protein [Parachlamydia sp. AcF125]